MMKMSLCYIAHEGIAPLHDMFTREQIHDMILWPERSMTETQLRFGCKYVDKSVVTGSPLVVSTYKAESVLIWSRGQWRGVREETYGATYSHISVMMGYTNTIPANIISFKKAVMMEYKLHMWYAPVDVIDGDRLKKMAWISERINDSEKLQIIAGNI